MGWDGPMTSRQYEAWQAWLDSEWDVPSRPDWYAMQVSKYLHDIKYMLSENPPQREVRDFKLQFKTSSTSTKVLTPEEQEQEDLEIKHSILGALGL